MLKNEMAKMLREKSIAKLFGITWLSEYFKGLEHLFTEILPGNLPDVRELLGLEPPPQKVTKTAMPVYVPRILEDSRGWLPQ